MKKKQFCDFIEAKFIRIFQEKIAEIDDSLGEIDDGLDEKIKTVKLNLESVKNGVTDQIEKEHVSNNIIDGDNCNGTAAVLRCYQLSHLRKK